MNLDIDFGLYSIDLKKTINCLKQDLTDDWFKDPLLYNDRMKNDCIKEYFENNITENNGIYKPKDRVLLNIPKPSGTLRYSLETNFFDRFAYHAYGITLIKHFDSMLSNRVFNHRFNKKEFNNKRTRYLFHNPINQWKKFDEFVKIDSEESSVLFTDLQNYYEHINIEILKSTLYSFLAKCEASGKEKSKIRFCIDSICNCLCSWTFNADHGLPQNRDISSFLANVYMHPIDEIMINEGYDYYRYMDDIKIICKDEYEARKALKKLCHELRKVNLTANGSKTLILNPGTDEHRNFIEDDGIDFERLDAMLYTKKKQIVAIAYAEIKLELEECIIKKDFDSRRFRFLLNRISKISLCKEIKKPENYFNLIKDNLIDAIVSYPTSTDSFYNLLSSIDLNENDMKKITKFIRNEELSIYSWQNYQLWKLIVLKNYKNQNLNKHAKKIITSDKTANMCGALLYLGKNGSVNDKLKILKMLDVNQNLFVQRHCLIAIQELSWKEVKVYKHMINEENIGIYNELHGMKEHQYTTPPKEIKFYDIFNQVGFYA